ncbi:MAG TPA: hypothetical protein VNS58_22815 [Puia sp.]|nr:hypothetical protein [Puia sp.]
MIKNEHSLEKCRQLIESSLNWGDAAGWTNEDFEDLSERIFDRTELRLSVSTLKRIWGKVRYENSPTAATLNALARFAGYSGWREFLQQHPEQSSAEPPEQAPAISIAQTPTAGTEPPPPPSFAPVRVSKPGITRRRLLLTSILVSAVLLLGLISLLGLRRHSALPSPIPADLTFSSRKTSEDLPNSVVFNYDASSLHPHTVIIQQSWDTTRREKIPANGKEYTSIYYYPGYFAAKLIVDGTIRKECPVFIKTKGWRGIVHRKPLPIYLTSAEIGIDEDSVAPDASREKPANRRKASRRKVSMGISSAILTEKTGSAIFNNTWVDFDNVREFEEIPADHFTLSTTLRNTSTVEQCLCRKIKITVLGTESAIIIPLADKGCISDLGLLTGDRMINGKNNDLSAFGCDFRDFAQLSCTVEDHRLKILLNQNLIFNTEQRHSIGGIVGIRIAFEGAGEIRSLSLQGPRQYIDLLAGPPMKP